ncbi:MAG: hypothetical protein U5J83_05310 [Bryobacterales bacterium]|nr:hypothetical protein [Bryobacterales bacterium]
MDYQYVTGAYGSKQLRQVSARILTPNPGGSSSTYSFERTSGATIPATTRVIDASNLSDKVWAFDTNTASISYGLWTQFDEIENCPSIQRQAPPGAGLRLPTPGQGLHQTTRHHTGPRHRQCPCHPQQPNGWYALWKSRAWATAHDFGPSFADLRTIGYTYSYPTNGGHRDTRIYNRVSKLELTQGGTTLTMQQTAYGNGDTIESGAYCPYEADNFEGGAYCTTSPIRANVKSVTAGGLTTEFRYDYQGNLVHTWGASPDVTSSFGSGTNYALPTVITPNNTSQLATSFTYDGAMRPTQTTAPNNAVARSWYDSVGRVNKSQSPVGSYTHYYRDYPNRKVEVAVSANSNATDLSNRTFARTFFDGLGRPVRHESGGSTNTVTAITETEYEPCACSPTGKMKRVSLPYLNVADRKWITYAYDALGRTLSVAMPDGNGSTTYEYVKNTVKITDPAGSWKKYESNALGELAKVTEPNAQLGGPDVETLYVYNSRGQLTTATMTREGATQVRSFVYDAATGRLDQATKPETGTTKYFYNTSDGTLNYSEDAKGQKSELSYDTLKRVTAVKQFIKSGGVFVEQPCQEVNYTYDSGSGSNLLGRVAKITSKSCEPYYLDEYNETFSYHASGLLDYRDSRWVRTINPATTRTLRVQPTWNSYGQMTGYAYGTIGQPLTAIQWPTMRLGAPPV